MMNVNYVKLVSGGLATAKELRPYLDGRGEQRYFAAVIIADCIEMDTRAPEAQFTPTFVAAVKKNLSVALEKSAHPNIQREKAR